MLGANLGIFFECVLFWPTVAGMGGWQTESAYDGRPKNSGFGRFSADLFKFSECLYQLVIERIFVVRILARIGVFVVARFVVSAVIAKLFFKPIVRRTIDGFCLDGCPYRS